MQNKLVLTKPTKVLTEQVTMSLKLSTAERRTIEEITRASDSTIDHIVSGVIHTYLHAESKHTLGQNRKQDELMKDLRKQMRVEHDQVRKEFWFGENGA